ncbi:POL-like protein [Mya arenaria]|uniref:POL-like protein n=1 Tax=Mya arenaria TaxID=6604 RepID=A0ABY7DSG0_MYAAR|nr:POL-like protein [Mya arenaria]
MPKLKAPEMGEPVINQEIWKIMNIGGHLNDKLMVDIQNLVADGIGLVLKLVNLLKDQSLGTEAKGVLSDTLTILGQTQYNLSMRRRYMIRPALKKKYAGLCNLSTEVTKKLFGDHIDKEIKSCETLSSIGKDSYPQRGTFARGCGRFQQRRGGYGSTSHMSSTGQEALALGGVRGLGRIPKCYGHSHKRSMESSVGKLKLYVDQWKNYTNDSWIINAVSGYKIYFVKQPYQEKVPNEIPFDGEKWEIVNDEIRAQLLKLLNESEEFISTLFIVPKPNNKFRPVINLRFLNKFVGYNHFKQEIFNVVLDLVQRNDFFTKMDLLEAYFSVPIHDDSTKYLKFSWNGLLYKFICLPFGLAIAPFLFTKILKPIYAWFRKQSVRCSYYIDDSLNMNQDKLICSRNTEMMTDTLESLGFVLNREKSVLKPCQRILFFGFILDSVEFKAKTLLSEGVVVIRDLASFIGLLVNAFYAVFEAKLHFRDLD